MAYVVGLCGTRTGPHGRPKADDDNEMGLNVGIDRFMLLYGVIRWRIAIV